LKRDGLSERQRQKIEETIATLKDAKTAMAQDWNKAAGQANNAVEAMNLKPRVRDSAPTVRRKVDLLNHSAEEIREQMAAEKRRHAERMKDLESSLPPSLPPSDTVRERNTEAKKTETKTLPTTEIQMLREQLEVLRKEVQELKKPTRD
jgi:hypothetical protein